MKGKVYNLIFKSWIPPSWPIWQAPPYGLPPPPLKWKKCQTTSKLKLGIHTNFNILKTAYCSLYESHFQYGTRSWGQKTNETIPLSRSFKTMPPTFKKCHDPISCVDKECKILEFPNILNLQNCLFFDQSPKLSTSFPALHPKNKHKYNTRSTAHNLLDTPLTKTNSNVWEKLY